MPKFCLTLWQYSRLPMLLGVFLFALAPRSAQAMGCVVHERPTLGLTLGTEISVLDTDLAQSGQLKSVVAGRISPRPCSGETPGQTRSVSPSLAAMIDPLVPVILDKGESCQDFTPRADSIGISTSLERPPRPVVGFDVGIA